MQLSVLRACFSAVLLGTAAAQWSTCKKDGETCGFWGVSLFSCCDGSSCVAGLDNDMRCRRPPRRCLPENAVCGIRGYVGGSCCDGLSCQSQKGKSAMRCALPEPDRDEDAGDDVEDEIDSNATESDDSDGDESAVDTVRGRLPPSKLAALRGGRHRPRDHGEDDEDDEHDGEDNDSTTDGNATASDPDDDEGEDVPGQCRRKFQLCGDDDACCGNLQCKYLDGADHAVCLEPEEFCRKEGTMCGDSDDDEDSCCDGLVCRHDAIFTKRCLRPPVREPAKCMPENAICRPDSAQDCCEGSTCRPVLGGTRMRCRRTERKCEPAGAVCGLLGYEVKTCCGGLSCVADSDSILGVCTDA